MPIGGNAGSTSERAYDMNDLLRFARTWNLYDCAPEEIYSRYVNQQVDDAQVTCLR